MYVSNVKLPHQQADGEDEDFETGIITRDILTVDFVEGETTDLVSIEENIFFENGCCQKQCFKLFAKEEILKSRFDCISLNSNCDFHSNHQDILLTGALNCLVDNNPDTSKESKHKIKNRERAAVKYMFRGKIVCKSFFVFVHGVGPKKFKNIVKHVNEHGVELKEHKLSKNIHHSFTLEQRVTAVTFIKSFSEQNSLVLPGRLPYYSNPDLNILPSSMTKQYIYEKYVEACTKSEKTYVGRSSWYKIWDDFCPHIVIQKPRTDLCHVCQQNVMSISKSRNMDEEVKTKLYMESVEHLQKAQTERQYYKDVIAESASQVSNCVLGPHPPCSFEGVLHISFDFAQQIHLPHDSQQVGPLYFLTGYKVALFGIAVEPLGKFILYVIPEACVIGKGANVVISLIHNFFETLSLGETNVICHADNCCGQNKNNYVLQYAVWRVMTARHKSFQLSFLPVGHTKFAPDQYFGLFKKKFRRSVVNTVKDVCEIAVTACKRSNSIMTVLVGNESGDAVNVKTYDWVKYFTDAKGVKLQKLKSFSHFKTESTSIGLLQCTKNCSGEGHSTHVVFTENKFGDSMPTEIEPQGLSSERQKYLFEKIRPFVLAHSQDILCPQPKLAIASDPLALTNSEQSQYTQEHVEPGVSKIQTNTLSVTLKRKSPTCSYCGESGHRNQIRSGIYFCKKRKLDEQKSD
ncbi:uncharacterized protein LOC106142669 [Amyelois transitella]|uniref:uncharacterized protein LOC106142669 n=1 Tax=Amyelois transitella TaxID=680683 RepID=UPI0029904BCF|nr:uncharacterized protein LOC106142669 [Amyelois transitella]